MDCHTYLVASAEFGWSLKLVPSNTYGMAARSQGVGLRVWERDVGDIAERLHVVPIEACPNHRLTWLMGNTMSSRKGMGNLG